MKIQAIDVPMGGCFVDNHGFVMHRVLAPNDNGRALFANNGRLLVCAVTDASPAYFFLLGEELVDAVEYSKELN